MGNGEYVSGQGIAMKPGIRIMVVDDDERPRDIVSQTLSDDVMRLQRKQAVWKHWMSSGKIRFPWFSQRLKNVRQRT